jgi:transposase
VHVYASLGFERRGDLDVAVKRLLPTHFAADACCSPGCGFGRLGGNNPWLFTEKPTEKSPEQMTHLQSAARMVRGQQPATRARGVRVIDVFVGALDLGDLGFDGIDPAATGRPAYHPSINLKLYIYGYLNRVQSSRRLEREAGRNVEVMWLLGRLAPDHKAIADFRKDNGPAIKKVRARFVELCRRMGLLLQASVAIDGSKFKAVNNRDKNFTNAKVERRRKQLEESVSRYLSQLDTADRQEPSETLTLKKVRIKEKLEKLRTEMDKLAAIEKQVLAAPDQQISLTDPDSRSMATSGRGSGVVGYNVQTTVDTKHHLIVAHEVKPSYHTAKTAT